MSVAVPVSVAVAVAVAVSVAVADGLCRSRFQSSSPVEQGDPVKAIGDGDGDGDGNGDGNGIRMAG